MSRPPPPGSDAPAHVKRSESKSSSSRMHQRQVWRGRPGARISMIVPKRLFISNLEGTTDLEYVKALGITHIVALLKTKPTEILPEGMFRLWIPVIDIASSTLSFEEKWPEILQYCRDAADKQTGLLIHCRAGMSRSSTITLAHLMDYYHMSLKDAFTLLQSKHPITAPITPFFKGLIKLEERLFRTPTSPTPWQPSMTLLDYQLNMISILFPTTPPSVFLETVQECKGNWLTAARVFHSRHPSSLNSFAMRYHVGATPYHPLCDLIAELRPDEAPAEASSGGDGRRERPATEKAMGREKEEVKEEMKVEEKENKEKKGE